MDVWPHRVPSLEPHVTDPDDGAAPKQPGAETRDHVTLMDGNLDTVVMDLTTKAHHVTQGADLIYKYGDHPGGTPTSVWRSCFLRAGQAAKAQTYDCRLPLRCTWSPRGDAGPHETAVWVAVAATKGTACKNRCMLVRGDGRVHMLNSAALLYSIGGDRITDAERATTTEALKQREKDATTGVLGGRGKKRAATEPEPRPKGSRKTAKPAATPSVDPGPPADTATLATSLVDALPDRVAGPLAAGLADHAAPIAKALAAAVAGPLAAALRPSVGKDLATAVKGILQQEARRERDRLQQRVEQLEGQLADAREQVTHLQDENADVRRTRDAAQAAADTERARSDADRAALHAANVQVAKLSEQLTASQQSTSVWRDIVEREATASRSSQAPTQLTAGTAIAGSQDSNQSTPSRPSQTDQVTPRRSPRK